MIGFSSLPIMESNAFYSITTDYKQKDIFYLNFGDISFDLKGVMSLSDTTLIYDDNFMVCVTGLATGDTIGKMIPEPYSGNYNFRVKPGGYSLNFSGNGYFSKTVDQNIPTDYPLAEVFVDATLDRDPSASRPTPKIVYEKIDLSVIPTIDAVDTSMLIKNMNVTDLAENVEEEILYYTVQVIALYNPCDVSYFKYINDIRIIYNESDKFYRYTSGEFPTREDAYKWRLDLISKGYPEEIFIKKVSKNTNQ